MTKLDIVGMTEIADMLGVKVQTVKTWNRRGVLPSPDAVLSCGPIWRRSTVARWAQDNARVRDLQQLGAAA